MSRTNSPSNKEKEAFFNAVEGGKIDKVQDMLSSNSRLLNIVTQDGATPLYVAAREDHVEIVKLLLNSRADFNKADNDGWVPLHIAALMGHEACVKLLIEAGADKDKANKNDATALYIAAMFGYYRIVKLLLDSGADSDKADKDGETPLYIAADKGHDKIVKLLLDSGANPNKAANNGWTPLMNAVRFGDDRIVKMIVEHILYNSAMDTILVAAKKGMKIYDAFEVYQSLVEKNLLKAAGLEEDLKGKKDLKELCELYNIKLNQKALWNVFEKAMDKTYGRTRTNSRFGKGKSKSKSNGKGKKPQKRPSKAVCTRAQKLGVRLTLKRNNKRVYKSEEMLRAQIKNVVTKRNKRKQSKRK